MSQVTPASSIPLSVDYTSKSYYEMRSELITRIQSKLPDWSADDPADFGVALVEAFAYLSDVVAYYIDRVANESFLTTASQRESVLKIANTYGYNPSGYRQAFVTLKFGNISTALRTIPAGTVISGDISVGDTVQTLYFTTKSDAVMLASDGVTREFAEVYAYEGRDISLVPGANLPTVYGELVGTSNGQPNQTFKLTQTPVVENSIEVYVQEGDVFSKWEKVSHIVDYGPSNLVYSVYTDEDNQVFISFGDGISGVLPTRYSEIRVKYTVGGGSIGNVGPGNITEFVYFPGLTTLQKNSLISAVTVQQQNAAIGGSDPESTAQIRSVAPLVLRANNRAVTLQDYADLSLSTSGVGKANATADVWTSVTVYVAPTVTGEAEDYPGLDFDETDTLVPTIQQEGLKAAVASNLEDKILLGTTVTISDPEYVNVVLGVQYAKYPQYTTTEVETAIKQSIVTNFGYNNMYFEETIYPQDIEFVLSQVKGIKNLRVNSLHREGVLSGLDTLQGAPNEIFRFTEENSTVSAF